MRQVVLALALALIPSSANAQVVELGGTMAAGCLGSDGSFCGTGTQPLAAAHASWWIDDRVELSARLARVTLPPFRGTIAFPKTVTFDVTDRSREFLSGVFVYHFRCGKRIRPMLGVGSGAYARVQRVRCEPVACTSIAGLPPDGYRRLWMADAILLAGASGHLNRRWIVRGGWLSHRFANDENSTIEWFAGVGYRF